MGSLRDGKWYLSGYRFLVGINPERYVATWDSFLEGMYIHHCCRDLVDGSLIGPIVIENTARGRFYIDDPKASRGGENG